MTDARYHELLGQLLDGSLSEADADELRRGLERDPDRLRDVREHLMLSEVMAQEQAPLRGPEAFWRGVQARLGAEADGTAESGPAAPRRFLDAPARQRPWRLAFGIAAAVLVSLALAVHWAGTRNGVAIGPVPASDPPGGRPVAGTLVSLRGEAVCAHCILHQADVCCPAVRVREGGREETLLLSDNAVSRGLKLKSGCCRTPLPVLAQGTIRTENGRQLLVATRLEVQP